MKIRWETVRLVYCLDYQNNNKLFINFTVQDQDIFQLQRQLKDAEQILATSLYQARQKLASIVKSRKKPVSSEELIKFAHRLVLHKTVINLIDLKKWGQIFHWELKTINKTVVILGYSNICLILNYHYVDLGGSVCTYTRGVYTQRPH